MEHYDQSTLTAEEAERHEELHWLRQRRIEAAEGTLAEVNDFDVHYDEDQQRDPDVVQYYKLSEAPEDSGIFREDNYNDEEVTQAMIKDQVRAGSDVYVCGSGMGRRHAVGTWRVACGAWRGSHHAP